METMKLSDVIKKLLQQGFSPRQVRLQLASKRIRWSYQFTAHRDKRRHGIQGNREKARRQRQARICSTGDGNPRFGGSELCVTCLEAKWGRPNA